jgi:hypothetical protein
MLSFLQNLHRRKVSRFSNLHRRKVLYRRVMLARSL